MSHFTYGITAADAVTLAERMTIEELELDLHRETSKRETVLGASVNPKDMEYRMTVIEHTDFIIPLIRHALAAKMGICTSQAWLDSLKIPVTN